MCRLANGSPYADEDHFWIRDKSAAEIQHQLICDKTPFSSNQQNDLLLSPVSVAFAQKEHLPSPCSPVTIDQIFRFVRFYVSYYRFGPGKSNRHAQERTIEGERVRFDVETKLIPDFLPVRMANCNEPKTTRRNRSPLSNRYVPLSFATTCKNDRKCKALISVHSD